MQFGGGSVIALAALSAVAAANEQGRVGLLFPPQWTPKSVVASVVHAEPTAVTYALDCPPKASDDCSLYLGIMTQGPQTWAYGGEWEDIMGVDEYTMNNACAVRTLNDKMICTLGVTQVKGGRTASTEIVSTTSGLSDFVYPIPITAGIEKLQDDRPKATKTDQTTSTSTPTSTTVLGSTRSTSSVPADTMLPTLDLKLAAADPTKDVAADQPTQDAEENPEDNNTIVEETPATTFTAKASVSRAEIPVLGVVSLVISIAIL